MAKGVIKFATESSEFLTCSCGNDVMDSGFELVRSACKELHYECARCGGFACVNFTLRTINNPYATEPSAQAAR